MGWGWFPTDRYQQDHTLHQGSSVTHSRTGEGSRGTQFFAWQVLETCPCSAEGFAIISTDKYPEWSPGRQAAGALMPAGSAKAQ